VCGGFASNVSHKLDFFLYKRVPLQRHYEHLYEHLSPHSVSEFLSTRHKNIEIVLKWLSFSYIKKVRYSGRFHLINDKLFHKHLGKKFGN